MKFKKHAIAILLIILALVGNSFANTPAIGFSPSAKSGAYLDRSYPSYTAANQGVMGDNNTIKDYVDLADGDNATIVLRHNSGSATTTYTLTTSETIPENITLKIERGAVIDGSGTLTFAVGAGFESTESQAFGTTITIVGLKIVKPVWFGSNAAAFGKAIVAASNGVLYLNGAYSIEADTSVTLTGDSKWFADGPTVITCTAGSEIVYVFEIEVGGYDFIIDGPIIIDSATIARAGIQIKNTSDTMVGVPNLYINNLTVENSNSDAAGGKAYGIGIEGGFELVKLDGCNVKDINRGASALISIGIGVSYSTTDGYSKNVIIEDTDIDGVSGSGTTDFDGLNIAGPFMSANLTGVGGIATELGTKLTVRGGTFSNCKGRSIKSQMEENLVIGSTFIRDSIISMANGTDVEFQVGSGTVKNTTHLYNVLPDLSTPFGTSFSVIKAGVQGLQTYEGFLKTKNITIINNVPSTTDTLQYGVLLDGTYQEVELDNWVYTNNLGIMTNVLYASSGVAKNLKITNCFFAKLTTLITFVDNATGLCFAEVTNNYAPSSGAVLWSTSAGSPPTFSNIGNNTNIGAGGASKGEGISLADDGVYTFAAQTTDIFPIWVIKANFNATVQGMFTSSSTTIVDLLSGAATFIDYGLTGTIPAAPDGTDGKLNIWSDGTYIHIKNRLGSSRVFYLNSI